MKFSEIKLTDVMKTAVVFSVLYNMVIVPAAAASGFPLPPIIIDEALRLLVMMGAIGG